MSKRYYIKQTSKNYSMVQSILIFTSQFGRDKYLFAMKNSEITLTQIIDAIPESWDPEWTHEMAEFRGQWFTKEELRKIEVEEGCEIRVINDVAKMNEHPKEEKEVEKLNVQQFRDRTASYYRMMNVDRASCVGEKETKRFVQQVKRTFNEAMEISCSRAREYDRKRFDVIIERMETFLFEQFVGFERIGLCS